MVSTFLPYRKGDRKPYDYQRAQHARAVGRKLWAIENHELAAMLRSGEPCPTHGCRRQVWMRYEWRWICCACSVPAALDVTSLTS